MTRRLLWAVLAACLLSAGLLATDGPLTNLMNLKGRTDENGYLRVSGGAAGATDGPLTALANLKGRTDENGYLRVALTGSPTLTGHLLFSPDNTYDIGASGATRPRTVYASNRFAPGASADIYWETRSRIQSPADGQLMLSDNAGTGFTRLQFGGTTSSYPALVRNSSSLDVKLADNSAYATLNTGNINVSDGAEVRANGKAYIIATAPTIASGFGTSPSIVASNGTAAFTINVGTGGTASSGVITLPAATTGWKCHVENLTAVAANRADQRTVQTATTTTSVTLQNQTVSTGAALAWTASDVLICTCMAY